MAVVRNRGNPRHLDRRPCRRPLGRSGACVQNRLAFQVAALALALPQSAAYLFASALLGGFAGLGVSAVALARARELAGSAAGVVWVRATALYALAQAAAGFGLTPPVCAHGLTYVRVCPRPCRVDCSVA